MRVLLLTYDSRGGVEPLLGLAVRLRALGSEVRVCAPPDCPDRVAEVGVPLVATGLLPAAAGARSVTEKLGIRYVYAAFCPLFLPSPHHPPSPFPGRPLPPEVTDNRVLWELNAHSANALFGPALNAGRASVGLAPVDSVYKYGFTDHPWLAADPTLAPWLEPADLVEVVQTGAWILPDERPLSAELVAFLDAGTPPVYVSFGSMRAPEGIARVAIEAIRAQGRRALVGRGWALSATLRRALTPETRACATAMAGTVRTDGATEGVKLLLDAVSRERPPMPA